MIIISIKNKRENRDAQAAPLPPVTALLELLRPLTDAIESSSDKATDDLRPEEGKAETAPREVPPPETASAPPAPEEDLEDDAQSELPTDYQIAQDEPAEPSDLPAPLAGSPSAEEPPVEQSRALAELEPETELEPEEKPVPEPSQREESSAREPIAPSGASPAKPPAHPEPVRKPVNPPRPRPATIKDGYQLADFWRRQQAPRDVEGRVIPFLEAKPMPDRARLAEIADSIGGRVFAYDATSRSFYVEVDLIGRRHKLVELRTEADFPTRGYSSLCFAANLPDVVDEVFEQYPRVDPDQLVTVLQLPPRIAARLVRKVELIAEKVRLKPEDIVRCRGRWAKTSFGEWIYEIQEVFPRGSASGLEVKDPEAQEVFGG